MRIHHIIASSCWPWPVAHKLAANTTTAMTTAMNISPFMEAS